MSAVTTSSATNTRARTVSVGIVAAAAGSALAYYGAYGDSHPQAHQESAVPFLIGVSCLVAALTFALVVPRMSREGGARIWTVGSGVVAVVLTPVVFWSGIPLVLGVAAVYGGNRAHSKATLVLGALAVLGSLTMAVLGNTVLSGS